MNEDLPAYVPGNTEDAETHPSAPSSLAKATFLTSIPSLLAGAFLVVAISISNWRGEKDEWGIGPFFLGLGLVLVALAVAAIGTAVLGQRSEQKTAKRSTWSVLGLGLAIIAAVPSTLIFIVLR